MAKIGNALWKVMTGGKCLVTAKSILRPATAWLATFVGAVAGAAVLQTTAWLYTPIGILQFILFFVHDFLVDKSATKTGKSAPKA
jgi:hypothetical protein